MRAARGDSCRVWGPGDLKGDKRPDVLVARRAADAWGVLSLDELFACGLSRTEVRVRVRNGRLHPLHRGVYAVGHANVTLEGRFLAAVKACGRGAVLSHHSAASLWGFLDWDDRYPEVTVALARARTWPRIHQPPYATTPPASRVHHLTARPLTSRGLDHGALRSATRRAQSLHRVNLRQLAAILASHRQRPGSARLARVVATGPAPTRSELEDAVLDLILRGGLAHPT